MTDEEKAEELTTKQFDLDTDKVRYFCNLYKNTFQQLKKINADIVDKGQSDRFPDMETVIFNEYPDDLDVTQFSSVPSYKRMCVCILKNDYYCIYMGFGKTKEAIEKRKKTLEKYKNL